MPNIIDPQTIEVNDLPGIWSPIDGDSLDEEEHVFELEEQAKASLLAGVDDPETILRLLLGETEITTTNEPPMGYDAEMQGEWDESRITFKFKRACWIQNVEREDDFLYIEYEFEDLGIWNIEIGAESVRISK